MTLIKPSIRALVALLLVSLLGMAAPAQAADSGSLTWGFKSSWRTYVTTIAAGTITTSGGATVSSGEYVFPQDSTTQTSPTGTGVTKYTGSVTWKSTAHGFDITMTDPWLEVTSSTQATLTADLTDNTGNSRGRVDVATVTLNDPAIESDSLAWTDRPTVITEDAAETFTNYANAAGDPLDAVVYKAGIGGPPAPLCSGRSATVQLGLGQAPTAGNDVIVGTGAGERIDAGAGNDVICALGGNDSLIGGDGNDVLYGEAGIDVIQGNSGNDGISGGTDGDAIYGGTGGDKIYGGSGLDTVSYTSATAGVKVTIDNIQNDGNAADGRMDDVRTDVERINGSPYPDSLLGSAGVNHFYGGGGADILYGYGGNDYLNGGTHADTFYGGTGNDSLSAKDGLRDKVIDGGSGTDSAARDAVDPAARYVP